LLVIVVALIAGVLLLAAERRELARSVIATQLRALGLSEVQSEVSTFGVSGLTVQNLRIGVDGDLVADEVEAHYSLAHLRAGMLDSIRIRGLRVRGRLDEDGLSLGALDPLLASDDAEGAATTAPLAMPIAEIVVDDFALTLATEDGDIDASGSLAVRAQEDRSIQIEFSVSGTHPQLGSEQPVEAKGTATVRDTRIDFDLIARNGGGELVAAVKGHHDLANGIGEAQIDTEPLEFSPDGLQPASLVPALNDWIALATGRVEARGTIGWDPEGGLHSGLDLGFSDFSVSAKEGSIDNLNAAVRVDGPWPLSTPAKQLLSMAQIDFGLQLQNGLISFQLRPDGILDVASAEWTLAGGKVHTRGRFDPKATKQALVLDLTGLDLAELLRLVDLAGLSGEGRLTGRVPIERRGSSVEIKQGVISATPDGGWIRYQPAMGLAEAASQGQGFDVVLSALRNFRFHSLSATLNGDTDGPVNLALHLAGANPDYLSGHPIEFNLNVEAHLVDLLRNATAVYRIPKQIEERLAEISGGSL